MVDSQFAFEHGHVGLVENLQILAVVRCIHATRLRLFGGLPTVEDSQRQIFLCIQYDGCASILNCAIRFISSW